MCDGSLAIWFKDGNCCHFPNTTGGAWYNRIVAAPSPGKWLRQNIYKILPYRKIRPPCPPVGCTVDTVCCSAAIREDGCHTGFCQLQTWLALSLR